ncbi:MAG: hypothetical protein R8M11_02460 [Gallionella sp.]
MSRNSTPLLALSIMAIGAITANRFITPAGDVAAAGVNTQGVAQSDAAIGESFTATVIGTEVVETGATIVAGALIETDATGRAISHVAGVAVARLAPGETATFAGEFVEVILFAN